MYRTIRVPLRYFGKKADRINSKQWLAHEAVRRGVHRVGMMGAAGSGKSYWLLNEDIDLCLRYPGYTLLLARWTQDSVDAIIRPLFYQIINEDYDPDILATHLPNNGWIAREERQMFANGSSIYLRALKSADDTNRYSKFDGLTLGAVSVSQAEEVPKDVGERLAYRLRQPDVPHHILFEMNPTSKDHYMFKEYGEHGDGVTRVMVHASVYDNAMNLPRDFIENLERDYPPGHPLRHRLIEGKWGATVRGEPVIGDLFNAKIHVDERQAQFDKNLPLLLAYDPGFQHPCLTWAQITPDGQLRILDCLLSSDAYADEFFAEAFQRQREMFGEPKQVLACADRASEQRRGTSTRTEWDIFRDHLRPWSVTPLTGVVASKQYLIQRHAARYTRLVRGQPAIVFHPRCEYLIEGVSFGWVWKPPTEARPNQRLPMADGWYEHGGDTMLYLEMHFGPGIRKMGKARDPDNEAERRPRRSATAAGY